MLDVIIIFLIMLTFLRGWQKGFLLSIIGPLSLVVGSLAAYAYYKSTGDMLITLAISILVPIALPIATACFIYVLKLMEPNADQSHSVMSRFAGGIIQTTWCIAFILVTFICVYFVPLRHPWIQKTRDVFSKSKSYSLFSQSVARLVPEENAGLEGLIQQFANTERLENLDQTPEFNELMRDPSFEEFVYDPEIQGLVEDNAVLELIQHPKFQELMQDPAIMDKMMAVYQNVFSKEDVGSLIKFGDKGFEMQGMENADVNTPPFHMRRIDAAQ